MNDFEDDDDEYFDVDMGAPSGSWGELGDVFGGIVIVAVLIAAIGHHYGWW